MVSSEPPTGENMPGRYRCRPASCSRATAPPAAPTAEGGPLEVVRSQLLHAETLLRRGHAAEAVRRCRAVLPLADTIAATEPDWAAAALAVHAHVCVAAGDSLAVQACRRYHCAAVDHYLTGARDRLVYAQGLNAALLAARHPVAAAYAFEHLLRRPLPPAVAVMAERALIAVDSHWRHPPSTPPGPAPLIPGGGHIPASASPPADCLAWLIHAHPDRWRPEQTPP